MAEQKYTHLNAMINQFDIIAGIQCSRVASYIAQEYLSVSSIRIFETLGFLVNGY